MTLRSFRLEAKTYGDTGLPVVTCFSGDPARAKAKMCSGSGGMTEIYKELLARLILSESISLEQAVEYVANPGPCTCKTPLVDILMEQLAQPAKKQKAGVPASCSQESTLGSISIAMIMFTQ